MIPFPSQQVWRDFLAFLDAEETKGVNLLVKESTKLEDVPKIRAEIKLVRKIKDKLNLTNEQEIDDV